MTESDRVFREALKVAQHNVKILKLDQPTQTKFIGRIETARKVMSLNPSVTKDTCRKFRDDYRESGYHLVFDGLTDTAYGVHRVACELLSACAKWYKVAVVAERAARKAWNYGNTESFCVARWESRGGKWWVELSQGRYDYFYRSNNAGGSVCAPDITNNLAATVVQAMLDCGQFLPDDAVIPMRRVK